MQKILGVLSLSLWAAALTFAPAPVDAAIGKYSTVVNYMSCSGYQSISTVGCTVECDDTGCQRYQFVGKMTNTIPLGACAGACNGTEDLLVMSNPGNGRKTAAWYADCLNGKLLSYGPCSTCS